MASLLHQAQSFMSLDQLHFIATGEHLSPRPGDACPHPAEWYIQRTQRRQQRKRAYDSLLQVARNYTEPGEITGVKPGEVNGQRYDGVALSGDLLLLYEGMKQVMLLCPDGHELTDTTPAPSGTVTPARPFRLAAAPAGRAECQSPLLMEVKGAVTGIIEVPAPSSRLRHNFRKFLAELSVEALQVELAEWEEEMERAVEHMTAVEEELARRGK